jgi:UDP-N-acetylmuramoyl-tripeptide--D-alanyl-D-alanine ligase
MARFTLAEIAAITGGDLVGDGQISVDTYRFDSRLIDQNDTLFIAVNGANRDGHTFIDAAAKNGAVAALTLTGHPHPTLAHVAVADTFLALHALAEAARVRINPKRVAITGSVGKTTVKDFTAAACRPSFRVHASPGSQNNELGVPLTVLSMPDDTQVLVSEIGARHSGDIAALAPLVRPHVSVVTAVAPVHLEIFGSIDAIATAKAELVEALDNSGTAVLNMDDPRVAAMAALAPNVLAVHPTQQRGDVYATEVTLDGRSRVRATVTTPWGRTALELGLPGRHHLANALFALGVAGLFGADITTAAHAIGSAQTSPWRSELHDLNGVLLLNDAYNANPLSMRAALDSLCALEVTGRKIAVLGVMAEIGQTAEREHETLGQYVAACGIDALIVVGDAAAAIATGAARHGITDVTQCATARDAAATLTQQMTRGDAVLVKASRSAGLETIVTQLLEGSAATERNGL